MKKFFKKYKFNIMFILLYILEIFVLFIDSTGVKSFFDIKYYFLVISIFCLAIMEITAYKSNELYNTGLQRVALLIFLIFDILAIIMKILNWGILDTIGNLGTIKDIFLAILVIFAYKFYYLFMKKIKWLYYSIFTKIDLKNQDFSYVPDLVVNKPKNNNLNFWIENKSKDIVEVEYIGIANGTDIASKENRNEIIKNGVNSKKIFSNTRCKVPKVKLEPGDRTNEIYTNLNQYIDRINNTNKKFISFMIVYKVNDNLITKEVYVHL